MFDFDGTLFDPGDGIMECARLTLLDLGMDVRDRELLRKFVGPPLSESFSKLCGLSAEQSEWAKRRYREYFVREGVQKAIPYPGMIELLYSLKQRGRRLFVASSKQERILKQIIAQNGWTDCFEKIYGDPDDAAVSLEKGEIIAKIIDEQGLLKTDCVMVGDRKYDVIGAREAGIDCIAVGFGYGTRQEFAQYQPNYMVESVKELRALLEDGK